MAQWLRRVAALPEGQRVWFPAPTWQLRTVCNSSCRRKQCLLLASEITGYDHMGTDINAGKTPIHIK